MYLSKVSLKNWRSYEDATFEFPKPPKSKPLTIVGAMNGHGKTSLLVALYLGLFGRYGLRYCEGFALDDGDSRPHYKKAVGLFRRRGTGSDSPTSVELVFSSTLADRLADAEGFELKVVRTWWFSSNGRLRQSQPEEVFLYLNGQPVHLESPDDSRQKIEQHLFPEHVMPAFIFDGEQAQLIPTMWASEGISKATEVMFGTAVLEEVAQEIGKYVAASRAQHGGKRRITAKQKELEDSCAEREALNARIADLQKTKDGLEKEKQELEEKRDIARNQLSALGGEWSVNADQIIGEAEQAERALQDAQDDVTALTKELGYALALSRLGPAILKQLESEALREQWESLRDGTRDKTDSVLQAALPEPPEQDPILGNLSRGSHDALRDRFRAALSQIYDPPPAGCADQYLLGHVRGDARQRLTDSINGVRGIGAQAIRGRVARLNTAVERNESARARRTRLENQPKEIPDLIAEMDRYGDLVNEAISRLSICEREIRVKKNDLGELNGRITKLQQELANVDPQQRRLDIAERVQRVTEALAEKLKPRVRERIEEKVTEYFIAMADPRFRDGHVALSGEEPLFMYIDGTEQAIATMSGFERRTFGIAVSLALGEVTGRRLPLVIDTPLGNADSAYRPRVLRALSGMDLDQIIILTHDQEVTADVFQSVERCVNRSFLVEFDEGTSSSKVIPDSYFEVST